MSESKELSFRGRRMSWVIETQGLSKSYGAITAVDNLSLKVPGGGVFGLLGPNGSGKTTTMGMLLGLIKPTAGSIRLFEDPAEGVHANALRRIGAIVEEPNFYPYLSGRDNLRYFQGHHGTRNAGGDRPPPGAGGSRRSGRQQIQRLLDGDEATTGNRLYPPG